MAETLNKLGRRSFVKNLAAGGIGMGLVGTSFTSFGAAAAKDIKIGVVGLSVHSAAFSQILNDSNKTSDLAGCTITALYHPPGNPDVDFTKEQLTKFESDIRAMGVKIVGSMSEMLALVDVVMIETNDGRPHMKEVLPAFEAGKPVFLDKPVAASLNGVIEIYEKAKQFNVPVFTSSALRYIPGVANIKSSEVLSASTFSPAAFEKSHTDQFWYGIHGIELLFRAMGPGCREVAHVHHSKADDLLVGYWNNDRVGTFRGIREGKKDFGGTAYMQDQIATLGTFTGYRDLVVRVVEFFLTKVPPVPVSETLEIYAFMEAAMESRKNGGIKVSLEKTLSKAYKANKVKQ